MMKQTIAIIASMSVFLMVFMGLLVVSCQETTDDTTEETTEADPVKLSLLLDSGVDFSKTYALNENLNRATIDIPRVVASGYRLSYYIVEVMLEGRSETNYPFALGTGSNVGKIVFAADAFIQLQELRLPSSYIVTVKVIGTNKDNAKLSTSLALNINIVESSPISVDLDSGVDFTKTHALNKDLNGLAFDIPRVMSSGYEVRYTIEEVMFDGDVVTAYPFDVGSDTNAGKIVFAADAVEQLSAEEVSLPADYMVSLEMLGVNHEGQTLSANIQLKVSVVASDGPLVLFTSSEGSAVRYMYQTNSADQGLVFTHTEDVEASSYLPEVRTFSDLLTGQSILYEVIVDDVIMANYFEIDQATRELIIKPVAHGLFDPRMNSDLEVGMVIPVKMRVYVAHDHDSNPSTPIEPVNEAIFGTFTLHLEVKGPRVEFVTNEVSGVVHLNCRCSGEMGLTGSALNDYYTNRGTTNVVINGVLSTIRVPTDSAPLADVLAGRLLAFEVLTNGHADLPEGASTLVRDGYFGVGIDRDLQGPQGANYTLRILSPKAHALWADTPSAIDSAITDMAATGDTRDIFVKVLVGYLDTDAGSYMTIDATVFDILKLTVTIGEGM